MASSLEDPRPAGVWRFRVAYRLAQLTSAGMLLVLLMGALVTNTDSGRGCGDDWPLCNGKFVPAYTLQSLIEWSHRFVTGLVTLLVLATLVAVFLLTKRRDARGYALSVLFFTLVQAVMGAMAVVWPQSSAVLALHFGISLLAVASTTMLVSALAELRPKPADPSGQGTSPTVSPTALTARTFSQGRYRTLVWLSFLYCYFVVYLGAYVRHTDASGGCGREWPLCAGAVIPHLSGATGVMFAHRIAALLLLFVLLGLARLVDVSGQGASVQRAARYTLVFVILQIVSGALVTFAIGTDWYVFGTLLHALLIACLFSCITYLAMKSLGTSPASAAIGRD